MHAGYTMQKYGQPQRNRAKLLQLQRESTELNMANIKRAPSAASAYAAFEGGELSRPGSAIGGRLSAAAAMDKTVPPLSAWFAAKPFSSRLLVFLSLFNVSTLGMLSSQISASPLYCIGAYWHNSAPRSRPYNRMVHHASAVSVILRLIPMIILQGVVLKSLHCVLAEWRR